MRSRLAGEHDGDERCVAAWSQSDAGYIPALRRYRDAHHPGASPTAILMLAICRAFGECGVALHDELEVVVDLRRFLPRDEFTLANFFGVAKIAIGSAPTMEELSTALRTTTGSLSTLLTLACLRRSPGCECCSPRTAGKRGGVQGGCPKPHPRS